MDSASLLIEIYGRIPQLTGGAVGGLSAAQLVEQPSSGANTIGWLGWHIARIQDHHVSELIEADQLWVDGAWASTFQLDPDPSNTGYGHSAAEVLTVRPVGPEAVLDYLGAVHDRTEAMLKALSDAELERVVDERWDPPVTLGVRLVSVADDGLQHVGQAAYVRGLLQA